MVEFTEQSPTTRSWTRCLSIYAFLGVCAWINNYLFFKRFGLYEDDYLLIGIPMLWKGANLWATCTSLLTNWAQGRPVAWIINDVLAYYCNRVGGLPLHYVAAFFIMVVNAVLLYHLVKRSFTESIAILTALLYCVFPADTSKILIHGVYYGQSAITFYLLAAHAYLSGWRKLSYVVIILAFLTYESCAVLFVFIPLMAFAWDRKIVWMVFKHGLVMVSLVLALIYLRGVFGDNRVSTLVLQDKKDALYKITAGMLIGPPACLKTFFLRPLQAVQVLTHPAYFTNENINPFYVQLLVGSICLLAAVIISYYFEVATPKSTSGASLELPAVSPQVVRQPGLGITVKAFVVGALMLLIAYALALTRFPPTNIDGRLSSVHLGATLGGSLLVASVLVGAYDLCCKLHLKWLAIPLLACYFASLITFGLSVQREYARGWSNTRLFWHNLLEACPDMDCNTKIVCVSDESNFATGRLASKQIIENSWADPYILFLTFDFPDFEKSPKVYPLPKNWQTCSVETKDNQLWLKYWIPAFAPQKIVPGEMILLHWTNHRMTRIQDEVIANGQAIQLKRKPSGACSFSYPPRDRGLYKYLFQ